MSRTLSATISERAFARLMADAAREGVDFRTYLAGILNDTAAARDQTDAERRRVQQRNADPPKDAYAASLARIKRINWNAVDVALDRAGRLPGRGR